MSVPATAAQKSVSLRELNRNSGRIVQEVSSTGQPIVITDDGRPVAKLLPFPAATSKYDRLLSEGKIKPPTREFDPNFRGFTLPEGVTLDRLLQEDRAE